jgi:hypothetical protein
MERHTWRTVAAVLMVGTLAVDREASAREDEGASEGPVKITVRVDDKAGVQGALLKLAEARAAEVFYMSGVEVAWVDGSDANRFHIVAPYTILIMAEAPAKLKAAMDRVGADVMGQAAPFIDRAYIYYDRVVAFKPIPPRDIVTTLGDVIAHELGHLILPPGHSNVGIMRPTVNMRSRRVETFTEAEAALIQLRVRERTGTPATR